MQQNSKVSSNRHKQNTKTLTPNLIKSLIIISLFFTTLINADYIRYYDMVLDKSTDLAWQDNEDVKTVTKNWEDAKTYCSDLPLGGYDDWYLPSIDELKTIVDKSKSYLVSYITVYSVSLVSSQAFLFLFVEF